MYIWCLTCMYSYMCTVWQNPEEGIRSPDLKVGMCVSLGTEPRSSTRAATALPSWAMSHASSPSPGLLHDVHERAWPLLFPSCNVLIRILYQNNADLKDRTIKYVRKHHPLSLEELWLGLPLFLLGWLVSVWASPSDWSSLWDMFKLRIQGLFKAWGFLVW